ncbi:Putative Acyl-coenzyme A oxidase [Rhizopus microsporus]|nr:Putative Acyl-coenzyme A oxidase [Rhizopus microsporus]
MGQIYRLVQLKEELKDNQGLFKEIVEASFNYSESLCMRNGVHETLFRSVVEMMGNDYQRTYWGKLLNDYKVIGCFAMTELGHSSALRGIETTATFDIETDEFVINSPTITSTKWWIGLAGQTATHAAVLAQTIIHGKNVGANWFIVPLRDSVSGEQFSNIRVGDIGTKVGHQGTDNGWIQFHKARVSRKNMMSKWARIDRHGTYQPAPNPAVMYATLIPERLGLVDVSTTLISQALTIAVRYGVVRRQGSNNEQIMDYQSHYAKLIPAISFIYMVKNSLSTIYQQFEILTASGEIEQKLYLDHMGDMHCMSASLKGLSGSLSASILEVCRRCCGGHTYSAYNALGHLTADWNVMTVGGGDDTVLLQQASTYLLHRLNQKIKYNTYPEFKYESSTSYFTYAEELLAAKTWHVKEVDDCLKDLSLIQEALQAILAKRFFSIQQALENGATHNDVLLDANRAAELHCAAFLYSDNARRFSAINNSSLDTSVAIIMRQMTVLWGLYVLRTYGDQGFLEGYISPQQLKDIEKAYLKLCKVLRKDVVGLTDAFGLPDFVLKAPIARYDGNIYQNYFDTILQAPNSMGVPPYHGKYIRPLTEKFCQILLEKTRDKTQ